MEMENAHIVRHVRYSEIDTIAELTWEEKQRLRARIKKKKVDIPLSLERLKAADNREWEVFVEIFQPKVINYIRQLTEERFLDDIFAESIINIFISRHMYNSLDHMIGSLHQFARHECFARGTKRPTRLLLSENIELFMDWDAYISEHEDEDLEFRKKKEDWKDKMLKLIADTASGLPPRWRAWIYLHLSGKTTSEVWRESKAFGMHQTTARQLCIRRLKYLVEEELHGIKHDKPTQLHMITDLVARLPIDHLNVLKATLTCQNQREAEETLGMSTSVFKGKIERVMQKLCKVYEGSSIRSPWRLLSRFEAIKNTQDEEFWDAVNQGIAKNTGEKITARGEKVFTTAIAREIILLRDQKKMSWENIGIALHIDYRKAREIYQIANPQGGALNWNKGDDMTRRAITMQQAVEIRKLYKTGNYTQPQLASKYGITRSSVQAILEYRSYKETA